MDEEHREGIKRHLEQCASCKELSEELTAVFRAIGSLESIKADPSFAARVTDLIHNKKPVSWWRRAVLPALVTAVVVVSVLLGIIMGNLLYVSLTGNNNGQYQVSSSYYPETQASDPYQGGF